ncbi:MAG: tRNA (guanosine(37)-N1)-methyltransferase TrmD [Bacteroidetes bacterium]|nr:MAG: tRNA (guanosine(37)-N1)-methyltransferase TrmD [Bacteroidota bacterium]
MHIDIITVLPQLLESPLSHSIVQRAKDKGLVEINLINLRDYATNKYQSVDDYQFGGGAGMVMMIEPIDRAISELKKQRNYDEIIYMTPDGERFTQKIANELSLKENLIVIAGHYKGVDQRVRDYIVTREISVGDYVLSGGELPAAVLCDAVVRLIPGVLNDESSALSDSFQDNLLAPPVYTRPADYKGWKVPEILTSGNTREIEKWRLEKSLEITRKKRPDLLNDEES